MSGKKIMIVDDDQDLAGLLKDLFVSEGFEVVVYADKNSVKGVIINRPDIVLLDERLRDGFGHDLCREMKANELTADIPVILISGAEHLSLIATECGADDHLAKPFDVDALRQLIADHLFK